MLSLNRYSLEATRSGNTINLVSNDVQKIEKSLNSWAWCSPRRWNSQSAWVSYGILLAGRL